MLRKSDVVGGIIYDNFTIFVSWNVDFVGGIQYLEA